MRIKFVQDFVNFIAQKEYKKKYRNLVESVDWLGQLVNLNSPIIDEIKNKKRIFFYKSAYENASRKLKEYYKTIDVTSIPHCEGELREFQLKILDFAYELTKELEQKINITPMLTGGCLIGVVRHKGFIPWDDDLDFDLMRDEFNRLLEYVKKEYVYVDSDKKINYEEHLGLVEQAIEANPNKIVFSLKPSCLSAYFRASSGDFLTVDFFPRDYINPKLSKEDYYKYRDKFDKEFYKKEFFSNMFSIYRNELKNADIYSEKSDLTAYGWGNISFKLKKLSVMKIDDILPARQIEFEGRQFYSMKETEKYLRNFYGDYMSIPVNMEIAKYTNRYKKVIK